MVEWMKKKVLFLCTGNSCRSQMGEGWLRHLAGDQFEVYSAGVDPTIVNPLSIQVMEEAGVDISSHTSVSIHEYVSVPFDYVITVCHHARQACPALAGEQNNIHWDLSDPARADGSNEQVLTVFRNTRDHIQSRVKAFLREQGASR